MKLFFPFNDFFLCCLDGFKLNVKLRKKETEMDGKRRRSRRNDMNDLREMKNRVTKINTEKYEGEISCTDVLEYHRCTVHRNDVPSADVPI